MSHGTRQFDVAHALTTDLGHGDFNTTLLTDHTTVLHALVLAAQTLVVLHRAEDFGTEQTFTLRVEGTVVNGFRLFNFTEGSGTDHFRRRQTDTNGIELVGWSLGFQQIQQIFHYRLLLAEFKAGTAVPAEHATYALLAVVQFNINTQ